MCGCGLEIESTQHCFLRCRFYHVERSELLNNLYDIDSATLISFCLAQISIIKRQIAKYFLIVLLISKLLKDLMNTYLTIDNRFLDFYIYIYIILYIYIIILYIIYIYYIYLYIYIFIYIYIYYIYIYIYIYLYIYILYIDRYRYKHRYRYIYIYTWNRKDMKLVVCRSLVLFWLVHSNTLDSYLYKQTVYTCF